MHLHLYIHLDVPVVLRSLTRSAFSAGAAASQSAASVHMGLLAGRAAAAPAASGVATTVLGAMGTHPKNAGVQLAGCHALWSLAYKVRAQTDSELCCGSFSSCA